MLQRGDSLEKGYPAMLTVSANLKREIRRMPPCIIQISNEQHSQTSITLTHPKRVLILQDPRQRMMPCTMSRCPSAVPGRSVVSANNLDPEVKGHGKFEQRHGSFGRVFNTSKVYLSIRYDIYYVSIITLTWRDSCIKRWQFSTSTLYHPKFEWATLAKEGEVWLRAFHSFHLIEAPVMTCHDVTLPTIRRWTRTWRLRRVPDWGIFSVKRLHWFGQAAICLPANPSIIFALCEFKKAKWKAFESQCCLQIEQEDQNVCHENRCLEITSLLLISTSYSRGSKTLQDLVCSAYMALGH